MYFDVIEAKHVRNHEMQLRFEDGSTGTVDFAKFIEKGTVLEEIDDIATFKAFEIQYGTIVWKNGTIDIAPETLYSEATGRKTIYPNKSSVA
jgi:hypothetical protein